MTKVKFNFKALLAAVFMSVAAPIAAFAAECEDHKKLDHFVSFLKDLGSPDMISLTAEQKANIVAKLGQPPHAPGEFNAFFGLAPDSTSGVVFIEVDGCVVDMIGPAPAEALGNLILGRGA